MYHVNCLRKLNVESDVIVKFYNCVTSSVLTYAITSWYGDCTKDEKSAVMKFSEKVSKSTKSNVVEVPESVYEERCVNELEKIMVDDTHPLHRHIVVLPHGHLRSVLGRTNRYLNTMLPSAIRLHNM